MGGRTGRREKEKRAGRVRERDESGGGRCEKNAGSVRLMVGEEKTRGEREDRRT